MRPAPLFTPAARDTIIERIAAGDSLARAATTAGVSTNTCKRWIKRGGLEPDGAYGEFRAAIEHARAAARQLAPPSEAEMSPEEFRACVERGVRRGQVSAMSLFAAHYLSPPEPEPAPVSAIARLAAVADATPIKTNIVNDAFAELDRRGDPDAA